MMSFRVRRIRTMQRHSTAVQWFQFNNESKSLVPFRSGVVKVKFKRLSHGEGLPIPSKATPGSAGIDVMSAENWVIPRENWVLVKTGFAIEIPSGYEVQVRPRSGLAMRGVTVLNAPGTIDSDYRGEVMVLLANHNRHEDVAIKRGDRIAQLVISRVEDVEIELADELSETDRGNKGFGSTGR